MNDELSLTEIFVKMILSGVIICIVLYIAGEIGK